MTKTEFLPLTSFPMTATQTAIFNRWNLPLTCMFVNSERINHTTLTWHELSGRVVELALWVVNRKLLKLRMAPETRNIWISACVLCALTVTRSTGKPNIIIMLMDDVGVFLHNNCGEFHSLGRASQSVARQKGHVKFCFFLWVISWPLSLPPKSHYFGEIVWHTYPVPHLWALSNLTYVYIFISVPIGWSIFKKENG